VISTMTITEVTDRPVLAASPVGMSLSGARLSVTCALLPVLPVGMPSERPIQASAVAAAKAQTYAFAAGANGAGAGNAKGAHAANGQIGAIGQIEKQKKTQHGKWASRGLEPWSDPA
jgi:hypothetical protein